MQHFNVVTSGIKLLFICLILFACSSIDINNIEQRKDGLMYYKGTNRLVNGIAIRKFEDGRIAEKASYKSGKQIGEWNTYDFEGDDFTHGYGIELDKQIVDGNKKFKLVNSTFSITIEGNFKYASIELPDHSEEPTISDLMKLRTEIYNRYAKEYGFKEIFIFFKRREYRFENNTYSLDVLLDTIKSNERFIINVR